MSSSKQVVEFIYEGNDEIHESDDDGSADCVAQ